MRGTFFCIILCLLWPCVALSESQILLPTELSGESSPHIMQVWEENFLCQCPVLELKQLLPGKGGTQTIVSQAKSDSSVSQKKTARKKQTKEEKLIRKKKNSKEKKEDDLGLAQEAEAIQLMELWTARNKYGLEPSKLNFEYDNRIPGFVAYLFLYGNQLYPDGIGNLCPDVPQLPVCE